MNARQLCNAAYTALTEWLDEKERRKFDLELHAPPDSGPVSHGTSELLALMGGVRIPMAAG